MSGKRGLSITPAEYQLLTGSKLHQELVNKKGNKYKNKKCVIHGVGFDSMREAKRYEELIFLGLSSKISNLKLQERINLLGSFKTMAGELIRGIDYVADFTYIKDGVKIIEDVKSEITRKNPAYINKIKELKNKIQNENLNWKFVEVMSKRGKA